MKERKYTEISEENTQKKGRKYAEEKTKK